MEQFKIGDNVAYDGAKAALKEVFDNLTALSPIPDGTPIGNGETNQTGETVWLCRTNGSGLLLLFRESEILKSSKGLIRSLKSAYLEKKSVYDGQLLKAVKDILREITPDGAKSIRVDHIYGDGLLTPIGKFCTPKDEPGNYLLLGFGLEGGRLHVDASEECDDRLTWEFSEYDLETVELEQVYDLLETIRNGSKDDFFSIGQDGYVERT